ncbi:HPr family phosphocarrier protein [Anaeropeptidivorans aminofermentans]|jgi:phosphotransferase system HPr (HPr) family protein|uniref:HPr family phosphocarrier protein n=1 Tax=Anaeropeptidivorans aminofermentans TaxID=2934315 RepID=UPI00202405CA|nr:HPr family phosphocarrier protein [Anaeropeptidivorans aminofermentans]MBE6011530.1 HPr family phosphocarrier protein [Lachnospiraceae bacterium]
MIERSIIVASNLEARPAALFVQLAGKFKSSIKININNKHSNAKSIMGIISLGIMQGDVAVLSAEGEDANEALDELEKFLTSEKH